MASIIIKFEGEQWHILLPCTSPNLPAHVVGQAYWVPFRNEECSTYHVHNWDGVKFSVELVNRKWYQLTWGTSGYCTSPSSIITPYAHKELGLGCYHPRDPKYEVLMPTPPENNPQLGGAMPGQGVNMHSPRKTQVEEEESSEEESPQGIQVEESSVKVG